MNSETAGNGSTVPTTRGSKVDESAKIETVNNPAHYGGGDNPYEVIKVIHAWELSFDLGSAVKYIGRKPDKKVEALEQGAHENIYQRRTKIRLQRIDDLKKAIWYINSEIGELEKQK